MAKAADSLYFLCDTTITPSRRSGRTTTEASTAATILCTGYAAYANRNSMMASAMSV